MKKCQKFLLLIMSFNIMFFAGYSKKREADASIAGMTAAAIATAASVPLSTVLIGVAGLAAVGAAVYYSDDIVRVGTMMVGNLTQDDVDQMVNETEGTVKLNAKAVDHAANATSALPKTRTVSNEKIYSSNTLLIKDKIMIIAEFDMPILDKLNNRDVFEVEVTVSSDYKFSGTIFAYIYSASGELIKSSYYAVPANGTATIKIPSISLTEADMPIVVKAKNGYSANYTATNVTMRDLTVPKLEEPNRTVANAPATVRDMQEYAVTNNVVNNTMTIPTDGDLTGVALDNLLTTSTENLNESIIQTGILSKIWDTLKNLPSKIAAAFSSLFTGLQNFLAGLWEDAGLVWSGMAEKMNLAKGVLDNILAGIMDNVAGGIDNLKIGLDNLLAGLSAGIDTLTRVFQDTWAGISAGLTAIGQNVLALPQTLLDDLAEIKTAVTGLVIPTALDMSTYTTKMDELRQKMTSKFEFITLPIQQIKSVFAAPKSLYDVKFTILEQDVYVLPRMFEPVVNITKNVLTGSAVISTFISIYRRFTPKEVIA